MLGVLDRSVLGPIQEIHFLLEGRTWDSRLDTKLYSKYTPFYP
jgi:hypothetical protein